MALTLVNLANTVTGTLPAANGGTGATTFPSPGTTGNVLTSNGTTWTSAAAAAFDAGTRMMFAQTAAPTGWTKDTTNYNNHALRVVTGSVTPSGGTVDFTTAFASQAVAGSVGTSGSFTLSTSEMPSHSHGNSIAGNFGGTSAFATGVNPGGNLNTQSTGGGGSHSHSGGTFTGTAINLAVKYLDVITATKN
jgi:hypothetical protein